MALEQTHNAPCRATPCVCLCDFFSYLFFVPSNSVSHHKQIKSGGKRIKPTESVCYREKETVGWLAIAFSIYVKNHSLIWIYFIFVIWTKGLEMTSPRNEAKRNKMAQHETEPNTTKHHRTQQYQNNSAPVLFTRSCFVSIIFSSWTRFSSAQNTEREQNEAACIRNVVAGSSRFEYSLLFYYLNDFAHKTGHTFHLGHSLSLSLSILFRPFFSFFRSNWAHIVWRFAFSDSVLFLSSSSFYISCPCWRHMARTLDPL